MFWVGFGVGAFVTFIILVGVITVLWETRQNELEMLRGERHEPT